MSGISGIEASGGTVHWLVADDGVRLRAACWPVGARGVVLLVSGRTEFIEKYAETIAGLQARGFAVWTMDLRGQGLSARALADPVRHHVEDFRAYLGDLVGLLDSHVRPGLAGRRLVLMGHSMGGHVVARLLAAGLVPDAAQAVLLAPMIDFRRGGLPLWLARGLFGAVCVLPGGAGWFGPGTRRAPMLDRPHRGNRLTSCERRFAADMALMRETPALWLGGVTWGWLRAAAASIAVLRRPGVVERIGVPVLVLLAGAERIVDNGAARAFAVRLRDGRLIEIAGARHGLLREADRFRLAAWAAIDAFLEAGTEGSAPVDIERGAQARAPAERS